MGWLTTKTLKRIRQLHKSGLSDPDIAKKIGCSTTTVWNWRQKFGLAANWKAAPKAFYIIYDENDAIRATGSARECAEALGIQIDSVYRLAHRAKKNGSGRVVVE